MVGCKQRGVVVKADWKWLDVAGYTFSWGQLFLTSSKVDIKVMEHHARAGEIVSREPGDERAAAPQHQDGRRE
jgi:hypothetical protein